MPRQYIYSFCDDSFELLLELDRKFVSYQNLKCLVSDLCLISKCYFSARASAIFMFTNYVFNIEFIKKYHNI